ncbi:MAG TPA: 7-carboxy-7-deazaguanine synthase QueE [Pirellulales bacterium]|jgi:7-carboxy-7-deazaguanine synthase|nr:7-carboxy-7-deazaguanine synthase QueE [Pirellulales bacterium]
MKIAEIYQSIQGEGLLTGTTSVFVRASGCNLRCWFCDTPYASWQPEGDDLGVEEIFEQVSLLGADHVVLTGGEPMLFAELIPLAALLRASGKHITIETAGTLYLPVECDLMSISPKLAGSTPSLATAGRWRRRHARSRAVPEVIRRLLSGYDYQLKFVIDTPADCNEVGEWLDEFPEIDRARVLLMPQGRRREELDERELWLAPYCLEHGLAYCHRRQIEWFGLVRGT